MKLIAKILCATASLLINSSYATSLGASLEKDLQKIFSVAKQSGCKLSKEPSIDELQNLPNRCFEMASLVTLRKINGQQSQVSVRWIHPYISSDAHHVYFLGSTKHHFIQQIQAFPQVGLLTRGLIKQDALGSTTLYGNAQVSNCRKNVCEVVMNLGTVVLVTSNVNSRTSKYARYGLENDRWVLEQLERDFW